MSVYDIKSKANPLTKVKNPIKLAASILAVICAVGIVLIANNRINHKDNGSTPSDFVDTTNGEGAHYGDEVGDSIQTSAELQKTNNYKNDTVLTYTYDDLGNTISFGVKDGPVADSIYLNPKCSDTSIHVGYYIDAENGEILHNEEFAGDVSYFTDGDLNYLIKERVYNLVYPAEYHDAEKYGIAWANETFDNIGKDEGTTIRIRAVDMDWNLMLATLTLTIEYKDGYFEITKLESSDVSKTKEISEEERAKAIESAVDFLRGLPTIGSNSANEGYWDTFMAQAHVEKTAPYFENLYNEESEPVHRGKYHSYDVYAVNIQVLGCGFATVYVAPWMDANGFSKDLIDPYNLKLTVIGYDAFHPQSEAALDIDPDTFYVRNSGT